VLRQIATPLRRDACITSVGDSEKDCKHSSCRPSLATPHVPTYSSLSKLDSQKNRLGLQFLDIQSNKQELMSPSKTVAAVEQDEKRTNVICASCLRLPLGTGGANPHFNMQLQPSQPNIEHDDVVEQEYLCTKCNTVWLRRRDKWGTDCGFRLKP